MSEEMDGNGNDSGIGERPGMGWWLGQVLLTGIACFFACFGVSLLVASYGLGDPFSFIMTFFAASLMTLISLVMVMGFVLRMRRVARAVSVSSAGEEEDKG
ncbi:hypothetical protein [uncultured Desulfosarcina sp.]|uniref:hypothetical protein n=1 Tax=uncultured Desulfosarcina sp. TaxID=218289 RepID=UPI0029C7EACF|nr:hypothetical protein [uncultured Desulfosarcina sp.]